MYSNMCTLKAQKRIIRASVATEIMYFYILLNLELHMELIKHE